jgi:hypothetical protein
LYFVPNAAIYHHIPDAKLTDEYFDRLSYNVGRSKALRAQNDEEFSELMASERRKRVVTYILAALYTIALQPIKGQYLIRMRKGIYKGIKQL